jgi:hypothetical protein
MRSAPNYQTQSQAIMPITPSSTIHINVMPIEPHSILQKIATSLGATYDPNAQMPIPKHPTTYYRKMGKWGWLRKNGIRRKSTKHKRATYHT